MREFIGMFLNVRIITGKRDEWDTGLNESSALEADTS